MLHTCTVAESTPCQCINNGESSWVIGVHHANKFLRTHVASIRVRHSILLGQALLLEEVLLEGQEHEPAKEEGASRAAGDRNGSVDSVAGDPGPSTGGQPGAPPERRIGGEGDAGAPVELRSAQLSGSATCRGCRECRLSHDGRRHGHQQPAGLSNSVLLGLVDRVWRWDQGVLGLVWVCWRSLERLSQGVSAHAPRP